MTFAFASFIAIELYTAQLAIAMQGSLWNAVTTFPWAFDTRPARRFHFGESVHSTLICAGPLSLFPDDVKCLSTPLRFDSSHPPPSYMKPRICISEDINESLIKYGYPSLPIRHGMFYITQPSPSCE